MIQELFKLILICSLFIDVFCYNIQTEWCSIDKNTKGRCRPQEDCFNATAVENSDCIKEETVCCPEVTETFKMCKTFGESLYNQDKSVAVGFNTNKTDTETLTCASAETPLIIGGEKAREKEFPYMAAIGYGRTVKDAKWHCGGTLITEYFVLSAAHCVKSKRLKSPAKWALLGILDLTNEDEPGRQLFDIVKRIKHPKYKPPSKEYDIMLFKLSRPAKLNEFVHPACLNMDDTINTVNVFATGWGVTALAETSNSDILMKVTLQIRGYDECTTAYEGQSKSHLPHGLKDSMLCVGFPEGGKDTCQGDSGGPITIGLKDPKCMYSIVGITSFGLFCGFSVPAVYTRVSYFVPWIMHEISKEK